MFKQFVEHGDDFDHVADRIRDSGFLCLGASGIVLITGFIYYLSFSLIGKRINYELRWRYILALMRQDTNWYDKQTLESIPTIIASGLKDVEVSSGRTIAFILYSFGALFMGTGCTFVITYEF